MSKDVVFTADESKPEELLKEFFEKFTYFSEEDKKRISDAWDFLLIKSQGVSHSSGSAYYVHAMRVAFILAQSEFDADCIISAFFHTYYNLQIPEEEIENRFGETVKKIVVGIGKIRTISVNSKTLVQADAIRKMLFAMSDDIRIIFIKIADRLDHIRNIRNLENEKQRALAAEIIDIWAPLADRLGMQQIKNEFEDLSLKYTNPDAFQQIKAVISQKKDERANYLNNAVSKNPGRSSKGKYKRNNYKPRQAFLFNLSKNAQAQQRAGRIVRPSCPAYHLPESTRLLHLNRNCSFSLEAS